MTPQKTIKAYFTGLTLCIVLTILSFWVAEKSGWGSGTVFTSLCVLAIAQLLVQAVCFLRLTIKPEGLWDSMPFLFTLFIIIIFVGGSLWIMYHLNYNML